MTRLLQLTALALFLSTGMTSFAGINSDDDDPKKENPWKKKFGKVKITPEEVSEFVHVDLGEIDIKQNQFNIEIENDKGEKIITKEVTEKSFNLKMEGFVPGIYLLKIITDNYVYTKSFTKI